MDTPFLTGLIIRAEAGLLFWGTAGAVFDPFKGLESKVGPFTGVFPMSANFQNGAGELVGICWLGRCAVLGGARRGWTRWGAGVTKEPLSPRK